MPVAHSEDVCGFYPRRVEQRVENRYRLGHRQSTTNVESGSGRGRHAHSPDDAHLVVGQLIAVHHDAWLTMPIRTHDLCRRSHIEPFRAVHRGRRKPAQRGAR
jgi:hypothetical protein